MLPIPKKRLIETIDGHAIVGWIREDFEAYAMAAVKEERERCASICESLAKVAEQSGKGKQKQGAIAMAESCAMLIRE